MTVGSFTRRLPEDPPHPRQEPRIQGPLTAENMERTFGGCVDFAKRPVALGGGLARTATLCYLSGMVKMERVSDYILRPLAQDGELARCSWAEAADRIRKGALYNLLVEERTTADQGAFDLVNGWCLLFLPEAGTTFSFLVQTEEKRAISSPENEPPLKGPRDSFVESIRTNTSILRRRVRTPSLRIREQLAGRQTVTPVDIVWIDGLTDPETVAEVERRVADIDIDAMIATGSLEEYIADDIHTAFPTMLCTERPDRFSAGVIGGRVGVLVDGLPLGWLIPGTFGQFFHTPQDKSQSWVMASALILLRYLCMLTTLFLPALYIAAVTFHLEMIPTRLAQSIIAAKQDVPFTTIFEVLLMLVAFDIIQEAGLRLPGAIGQTGSILGGWWWARRRWRPGSSPRRCSSRWPPPASPGTPCPPRSWRGPCGSGASCWRCWPPWGACSGWLWGPWSSSATWPPWRASARPIWPPSPPAPGWTEGTGPSSGSPCPR